MPGIFASLAYKYICKITLACESICLNLFIVYMFGDRLHDICCTKSDLVLKMEFNIHLITINENFCLVVPRSKIKKLYI